MSNVHDLIIELGTEELPAVGLSGLAKSFNDRLCIGLKKLDLDFSSSRYFSSPRRLAVLVNDLVEIQIDRVEVRRGPALDSAYNDDGQPTKAAIGFAGSCNVPVEQLEILETAKGKWLGYTQKTRGRKTIELLEDIVKNSLADLPIKKRMRWGNHEFEFVRPVHWLLLLYGEETVNIKVMNLTSGNISYGHRFLSHHPINITSAGNYINALKDPGKVIVDFDERKTRITKQIRKLTEGLDGQVLKNATLLDEVTGMVEWPVALAGKFDSAFLELPREVLIATMEKHQKSFAVQDKDGNLIPHFISVSNLESMSPLQVIKGYEKVLQPRLSDAAFFWKRDLSRSLEKHGERLSGILYQETLGNMANRSARISKLASFLANKSGFNAHEAERAGLLCKCDLVTDMVGEFPELQGIMGKYYAQHDNEADEVAAAIEEHYMPRFSGDQLPQTECGQVVAIADRLDSLVGIFSIGQVPTGDKDPFGLRRSALGILRILIEKSLDLNLLSCLHESASYYLHEFDREITVVKTFDYIMDRLRKYYEDQDIKYYIFDSVFEKRPESPVDFDLRIKAVMEFNQMPEAENLSSANKRIRNILKQTEVNHDASIDQGLLGESSEQKLFEHAASMQKKVSKLVEKSEYRDALKLLSGLQTSIDDFFDNVLVMDSNSNIRQNRVALLKSVSDMFLEIADISKLSVSK